MEITQKKYQAKVQNTTEDVVSGFTRKVANYTQWGAAVVVAPLAIVQGVAGHWLMTAWLAAFCVYSLSLALISRHQNLKQRQLLAFVSMLALAASYSTFINGINGFVWSFPVMASIVFLLRRKWAVVSAFTFFVLMVIAAVVAMPLDIAWRGSLSLAAVLVLTLTLLFLLETMQRSFTRLATTDTLTGVYNRKSLNSRLDQVLALYKRNQQPVSVVICDIDWFKPINDKYGHLQGDRLLVQAAKLIRQSVRLSDSVYRVGGEEFLILMPETDAGGAAKAAEQLRLRFAENEFKLKGASPKMTLSAGVAQLRTGEHWTDWLERADKRLYQAKESGRNQVVND